MAGEPQAPGIGAAPEQPAAPVEPQQPMAPSESEMEAEAKAAQHAKPKPSESHARPQKLVPAEHMAPLAKPPRGDYFHVFRGKAAGLTEGMSLQVVAGPVKDGKARLVGEAKVLNVKRGRSTLDADARVRSARRADLYVVLPNAAIAAATSEDAQDEAVPPTKEAPAQPATEPRKLSGRPYLGGFPPFNLKIELTNTDTITWSDCILVIRGRDTYKLGGMAPGGRREIPLADFKKGGPEVKYVGRNRLGLFCAEGQGEFPLKL